MAPYFFCQSHSIANVVGSTIICGEGKADALGWIVDIKEEGLQLAHITGGGGYVGFGFVNLLTGQGEMVGGGGHDLHESAGACPRVRLGVEA